MNQNISHNDLNVNGRFYHPILNNACVGHMFGNHKVTVSENRVLWTIAYQMIRRRSQSVTMSREIIVELLERSVDNVRSISRITGNWQTWGILEVKRGGYDRENRAWLPNVYSINWKAFFDIFGHVFDKVKGKIKALLAQAKSQFLSLSGETFCPSDSETLCPTLKTPTGSTKEEKTICKLAIAPLHIPKEKKVSKVFASCFAKGCALKKKFALKRKEVSPTMIAPSEAEENYMVKRLPRGVAKPFDIRLTVCPPEYIEAAIKIGVHPSHISDQFCQFADYWSMRRGEKKGRKTDWPLTWRVWVTKNFGDYRLGLKNPNPSEPQLLGNSEQLVGNSDELNYPEEVRGMVRKVASKLNPGEFESWIRGCIFEREDDSYTITVPKSFGTYKQHEIEKRFEAILMDDLKMTVIYET